MKSKASQNTIKQNTIKQKLVAMPMCIAFSFVATLIPTQIDNLQPIKELPNQIRQQKHQNQIVKNVHIQQ